jgi:Spy/CpxP family protein refolding chaperone
MQAETQKLIELVKAPHVDESAALSQVDKVLGIERDVKRQHVTLLIRIKNTLSPEQQAKLRSMRDEQ